jgi:hypothetical protein
MPQINKSRFIGLALVLVGVAAFIRSWLLGSATDSAGKILLGVVS